MKFSNTLKAALLVIATLAITSTAMAVTSKITRHSSAADLLKGETENLIIDSHGTIQLGREYKKLKIRALLENSWTINTIVEDSTGTLYLGTSPNGNIIRYTEDASEIIYPVQQETTEQDNQPEDPNAQQDDELFTNEHIFAMAVDANDRLLAAVSGSEPKLMAYENGEFKTIYQPEEALYILAIAIDSNSSIYLGTGPDGKVYRLDPDGQNPTLIYDSKDNNILSLTIDNAGYLYAGADKRGIIYKINPATKTASVLFDSEQTEITSLLLDDKGNLYAAATSAQAAANQAKFSSISAGMAPGRPDSDEEGSTEEPDKKSETISVANTKKAATQPAAAKQPQPKKGAMPKTAGHIYKIDPRGYVTDIFSQMAVFFVLEKQNDQLLLGTGNNAELIAVNPTTEQKQIPYTDKTASQITALKVSGNDVYIGASNPAKLIKLSNTLFTEGTYTSSLVDASQPARWGKLQIEADLPDGTTVSLEAHSGNVNDPNDPSFSPWTQPIEVTEPTQLTCPLGRYVQYRLTLTTDNTENTPVVRQIAIPFVVPNLQPKITTLTAAKAKDKPGIFNIAFTAKDSNADTLVYTVEFRKLGRTNWITLKEDLTQAKFDWNTRTVEDARYEVRVTANDERSNTPATFLTGSRISDTFIIDNTPPTIEARDTQVEGDTATILITLTDQFSLIGRIRYTLDSNDDWSSTLPDDLVYDTTKEDFTITVADLKPGQHIIAIEVKDDLGNTTYKTFEVEINE